jgi:hypothetical protein
MYLESAADETYARQVTAEEKRAGRGGVVEWVRVRPDNHMLDLEVLQLAMASSELLGGVAALPPNATEEPEARPPLDPSGNPWTRNLIGGNR